FRIFMKLVCPKWIPITRRGLISIQKNVNLSMLSCISETLKSIEYLSLTVDIWSDRRLRSFIGVTCHFVDELFEFKSIVLACRHINGSITGLKIKTEMDNVLAFFDIKNKVVKKVTDNGANMVKFGKLQDLVGDDEFEIGPDTNQILNDSDDSEDEESLNGEEENINFDSFGQLSSQATKGLHL
ncbi:zinc finger BED domain-containing 4-like, partial [Brachionus plicatilis]